MNKIFVALLFISCATTEEIKPSTAIICPDTIKSKLIFCNCFVEARTLEGNKVRYLFIPCPNQDGPINYRIAN